jgi:hypothetical protein
MQEGDEDEDEEDDDEVKESKEAARNTCPPTDTQQNQGPHRQTHEEHHACSNVFHENDDDDDGFDTFEATQVAKLDLDHQLMWDLGVAETLQFVKNAQLAEQRDIHRQNKTSSGGVGSRASTAFAIDSHRLATESNRSNRSAHSDRCGNRMGTRRRSSILKSLQSAGNRSSDMAMDYAAKLMRGAMDTRASDDSMVHERWLAWIVERACCCFSDAIRRNIGPSKHGQSRRMRLRNEGLDDTEELSK